MGPKTLRTVLSVTTPGCLRASMFLGRRPRLRNTGAASRPELGGITCSHRVWYSNFSLCLSASFSLFVSPTLSLSLPLSPCLSLLLFLTFSLSPSPSLPFPFSFSGSFRLSLSSTPPPLFLSPSPSLSLCSLKFVAGAFQSVTLYTNAQ